MTEESRSQPIKVVWHIGGADITIVTDEAGRVFVNDRLIERALDTFDDLSSKNTHAVPGAESTRADRHPFFDP